MPQHEHQRGVWLRDFARFKRQTAWKRVRRAGQQFIDNFRKELLRTNCDKEADIDKPLTVAMRLLLKRLGADVEDQLPVVQITDQNRHPADIAFTRGKTRWIVEIKTNLDFNSLGAAVLGAMAFRKDNPKTNFMLLCLYHKPKKGDLRQALDYCDLHEMIDSMIVLTRNGDGDDYYENFADRLNELVDIIEKIT